jgi:hypothetical protein
MLGMRFGRRFDSSLGERFAEKWMRGLVKHFLKDCIRK